MIMTFVKKLFGYLFTLIAVIGISAAFITLADRYLGDGLYGVIALTALTILYFITERSWQEAKKHHDEV